MLLCNNYTSSEFCLSYFIYQFSVTVAYLKFSQFNTQGLLPSKIFPARVVVHRARWFDVTALVGHTTHRCWMLGRHCSCSSSGFFRRQNVRYTFPYLSTALARKVMQSPPSVCPFIHTFVSTLSSEPADH